VQRGRVAERAGPAGGGGAAGAAGAPRPTRRSVGAAPACVAPGASGAAAARENGKPVARCGGAAVRAAVADGTMRPRRPAAARPAKRRREESGDGAESDGSWGLARRRSGGSVGAPDTEDGESTEGDCGTDASGSEGAGSPGAHRKSAQRVCGGAELTVAELRARYVPFFHFPADAAAFSLYGATTDKK
jgi:hypothetical protein